MGSLNEEDIKEILRRVDEFNDLEVGDVVDNGIQSLKIYHATRDYPTGVKYVSYLKSQSPTEELTTIDRDEYVLDNWVKILKEDIKT